MSITPKRWDEFQHYKDRNPIWIKLHRKLLDDFAFSRLPVASRALAPMLWLLASEYEAGSITASVEEIAFRMRMPEKELRAALKPLIDNGFFTDDSSTLASGYQVATPEKETETQVKTETESRTAASAARPTDEEFEIFKRAYPKRKGGNPWPAARKSLSSALRSGVEFEAILTALRAGAGFDPEKIGTEFIPQASTWLNGRRWEDHATGPPNGGLSAEETQQLWEKLHAGRQNDTIGTVLRPISSGLRESEGIGRQESAANADNQTGESRMVGMATVLRRMPGV